jgi:hypothetical protein
MPRGVPASGRRQSSSVSALPPELEAALAEEAEDVPGGEFAPVVEQEAPVGAPADVRLNEDLSGKRDDELTPEQREIKFLRDQLARSEGKKEYEPEVEELAPGETNIVVHFLEDGLTVNGRVMYRGDELEFAPGSRAYQDTFDRLGRSFLQLRHDEFGQVDRWGKVMFRNGPWPGKTYADGAFEAMRSEKGDGKIRPPSQDEIDRAEKARQRRSAPHLPTLV